MHLFAAFMAGLGVAVILLFLKRRATGFEAQRPRDYADTQPSFDLRRHLDGPLVCEGVIYGPLGRITSRFVADMAGLWDGNSGLLTERFRFDSGTIQHREWSLAVTADGQIRATAADVLGEAEGAIAGAAAQMKYRIRLSPEGGGHVLMVTDWMYLLENGTILNRSQFRKFGVKVAELVATIRKVEHAPIQG